MIYKCIYNTDVVGKVEVFILLYYKCSFPDTSIVPWLHFICVVDDLPTCIY